MPTTTWTRTPLHAVSVCLVVDGPSPSLFLATSGKLGLGTNNCCIGIYEQVRKPPLAHPHRAIQRTPRQPLTCKQQPPIRTASIDSFSQLGSSAGGYERRVVLGKCSDLGLGTSPVSMASDGQRERGLYAAEQYVSHRALPQEGKHPLGSFWLAVGR